LDATLWIRRRRPVAVALAAGTMNRTDRLPITIGRTPGDALLLSRPPQSARAPVIDTAAISCATTRARDVREEKDVTA